MMLVTCLLLVLLNEAVSSGSNGKEHVHFKIHVPEIIKHHVHTKTILVHVHKPLPRKKETPKKKEQPKKETPKTQHNEEHKESWSSWNSYDHHDHRENTHDNRHDYSDGYHKAKEDTKNYKTHEDQRYPRKEPNRHFSGYSQVDYGQKEPQKYFSPYDYQRDSYLPQSVKESRFQQGVMVGYSYPPQYAVHENTEDTRSNEIEPFTYDYEKGYRKGVHTETRHVYTDLSSKFQDGKNEETDDSEQEGHDDSKERTHAGRYFVDDTEYENNNTFESDDDHS